MCHWWALFRRERDPLVAEYLLTYLQLQAAMEHGTDWGRGCMESMDCAAPHGDGSWSGPAGRCPGPARRDTHLTSPPAQRQPQRAARHARRATAYTTPHDGAALRPRAQRPYYCNIPLTTR